MLHPTVHDEPPLRLSLFDREFRAPDAFALSTPEEVELIRDRFHVDPAGCGRRHRGRGRRRPTRRVSAPRTSSANKPYLLYVGRIDEGKGALALFEFFVAYKERHPGDELVLALVGDDLLELPKRDDIVVTGFVDYQTRDDVIVRRTRARPAVVLRELLDDPDRGVRVRAARDRAGRVARCSAATPGAAMPPSRTTASPSSRRRSRCCVDDPALADAMGAAGRAYVEREYTWDTVLDRYEALLERTAEIGAPCA